MADLRLERGWGCVNSSRTGFSVFTRRINNTFVVERQQAKVSTGKVQLDQRLTGFGTQQEFLCRFASTEQVNTVLKRQQALENLRGTIPDLCLAFKLEK
jgi:hypothetical protein